MSNNKEKNKKINQKIYFLIGVLVIIIVAVVFGIFIMNNKLKKEENELAYTELIKELSYGNVEKIEMKTGSTTIKVKMKNEEEDKTTIVPNVESFIGLVQAKVA